MARARTKSIAVPTVLIVTACGGGDVPTQEPTAPAPPLTSLPSPTTPATRSGITAIEAGTDPVVPSATARRFPVDAFATIREIPVTDELATRYRAALEASAANDAFAVGGGMTATVMTADGTWSGAVGTADGVRALRTDDQFAIASITKSVVATQVMLMVEAGEVALDDPVADHLPPELRFDANGATIRHLLSHRSGLPDYYDLLYEGQQIDLRRVWTPVEILELLPSDRTPPGENFAYAETNFLLLQLMIEHLRGRPLAEVLRQDALAVDGVARLIHQPDEVPVGPIALPGVAAAPGLDARGGYLPSLDSVTAFSGSGAMASDAPSLARWWRALCAGEIVSEATLAEMSAFDQDASSFDGAYGLGLFNPAYGYAHAVGHQGELFGYMSWAACLPDEAAVVVALTNRPVHDLTVELFYGAIAPFVDVLHSA